MYGWRQRYVSETHSTVSRMDELQAAILRVKLGHLDEWNATRQRLAARYRSNLEGVVELPPADGVFHLFVIQTSERDAVKAYLAEHAIATDVHYPIPAHLQTPYAAFTSAPLSTTQRLAGRILSLPLYPELPEETVDHVSGVLRAYGA
jgi:dTDP-3-amino-3,4,6-trideoxy-alpha-D-glucose transaminase